MGIRNFFEALLAHYEPHTGSRVRVVYGRAIIAEASLTQNAALANVEKAIGSLLATDVMPPESILATPDDKLQLHLLQSYSCQFA